MATHNTKMQAAVQLHGFKSVPYLGLTTATHNAEAVMHAAVQPHGFLFVSYLGLTILSFLGRLIQSWKPHRLPSVTLGISLCTIPLPAVIHCTPPGPITPCQAT